MALVTMTTDFGLREHYVGAMKGSLLSVNPDVTIVDISHEVAAHDLLAGAFTLRCAYQYFPARTIHLVVVDPGVGSERRGLVMVTDEYYFVAPDNGVLSLVAEREDVRRVISIEAEHYFRQPVSATFHGRDIFAPVSGWLAKGIDPENFGPPLDDFVRLSLPPVQEREGGFQGHVLHIDKFGNGITSFSVEEVGAAVEKCGQPRFQVNGHTVTRLVSNYSEVEQADEVFALVGSSGFYELAAQKKSAAVLLGLRRGMKVDLQI